MSLPLPAASVVPTAIPDVPEAWVSVPPALTDNVSALIEGSTMPPALPLVSARLVSAVPPPIGPLRTRSPLPASTASDCAPAIAGKVIAPPPELSATVPPSVIALAKAIAWFVVVRSSSSVTAPAPFWPKPPDAVRAAPPARVILPPLVTVNAPAKLDE